jgi:hypothetical protein
MVVETFERIEAAYDQRYRRNDAKILEWDGFVHFVFRNYILIPCWKMNPECIEREMWDNLRKMK